MMNCPLSDVRSVRRQHDLLVQQICNVLLRNDNVQGVKRERKSVEQEERQKKGQESKRADITYWVNGVQHSIDVTVTSGYTERKYRNGVTSAQSRKTKQYRGEENVHIILFDTSGNTSEEAWSYLRSLGATSAEYRRMQTVIFRASAERYATNVRNNKAQMYTEDRIRWRKRDSQDTIRRIE